MDIENIMYNRLKKRLTLKEKILFVLFKNSIIHIYREGFNDGYYFKK